MEPSSNISSSNPQMAMLIPIRKFAWLAIGVFLVLAFFLPNYTTPIIDISGLDMVRSAIKNPRSLMRMIEDMPTFFMVVTPFCYWFLGFVTIIVAGREIAGKGNSMEMFVIVFAGLLVFLSLTTAVVLSNRHDVPSFFAKALPKAGVVFYMTMFLEVILVMTGILARIAKNIKA